MKRFHFTLQAILTLREQQEQMAKRRYARALSEFERATEKLRGLESEQQHYWDTLRAQTAAGAPAGQMVHLLEFGGLLEERRQQLAEARKSAQQAADRAWAEMVLATQNCEAIKKYRERVRKAYWLTVSRAEQKILDDLGARSSPLAESLQATLSMNSI